VAPTSCSCHGSRGLVVGCRCRCRWARGWAHYLFMTNSWNFFFYSQWVPGSPALGLCVIYRKLIELSDKAHQ
jgi:hypothetical protein